MINRQFIIILLLLLFTAAVSYFLVWPAYENLGQNKKDLESWRTKVSNVKEAEAKLAGLEKSFDNAQGAEKLLLALPTDEDRPGLMVQLENLASINGLILNSLQFSKVAKKETSAQAQQASGQNVSASLAPAVRQERSKSLEVSFELSGQTESMRNFLESLENNSRVMDIKSLSFKVDESGEDQTVVFSFILNAYYQ